MSKQKRPKRTQLNASSYHSTTMAPSTARSRRTISAPFVIANILVILLIIIVAVSFWLNYYFSPKVTATRELPNIAKDYYENYYYPKLSESSDGSNVDLLKKYSEKGLPPIKLRQLLLYEDGKYSNYSSTFDSVGCNQNTSTITFTPSSPYNNTDYTIKYKLHCREDLEIQ